MTDLYEMPVREPGQQFTVPSLKKLHYGQHDDSCFACKINTLHFGSHGPASHVKNGNPWKDNPVVERIQELTGREIDTDIPRPPGAV